MNHSEVSVIIPTLNESYNIGKLAHQLHSLYPGIEVVVVDDGSSDATLRVAKQAGAQVIDRGEKKVKGLAASVLQGIRGTHRPNLIVMDADFQHPPEAVAKIIESLNTHKLVIAVREDLHWLTRSRQMLSTMGTKLSNFRLGRKVYDPLSGFFGIKRTIVAKCPPRNFQPKGYKILFSILKSYRGTIGYVSYPFNKRRSGQSNLRMRHCYYFLRNIFS